MPPAIIGDEALEKAWREQMEAAQKSYVALVESLMSDTPGWATRFTAGRWRARQRVEFCPNSTETKIVVTGNARAWRTMLELRSSEGAEFEIRRCAVRSSGFSRGKRRDFSPTSRFTRRVIGPTRRESSTTKSDVLR